MTISNKNICNNCGNKKEVFIFSKNKTGVICLTKSCLENLFTGKSLCTYPYNFIHRAKDNLLFLNACIENIHENNEIFPQHWKIGRKIKRRNLCFSGKVGIGKTYALWALFRDACFSEAYTFPRIISEPELFNALKKEMELGFNHTNSHFLETIANCETLFFDDLGSCTKTYEGEWGKQVLFDFIDSRYRNNRTTIFTTNLDLHDFVDLGERTYDRLKCWEWIYSAEAQSKRYSKTNYKTPHKPNYDKGDPEHLKDKQTACRA